MFAKFSSKPNPSKNGAKERLVFESPYRVTPSLRIYTSGTANLIYLFYQLPSAQLPRIKAKACAKAATHLPVKKEDFCDLHRALSNSCPSCIACMDDLFPDEKSVVIHCANPLRRVFVDCFCNCRNVDAASMVGAISVRHGVRSHCFQPESPAVFRIRKAI